MCQHCKIDRPLKKSKRKHGNPSRRFFDCPCGRTVEGTKDGREVKARAKLRPSVTKSIRLSLVEEAERLSTGETVRGYIERKAVEKEANG